METRRLQQNDLGRNRSVESRCGFVGVHVFGRSGLARLRRLARLALCGLCFAAAAQAEPLPYPATKSVSQNKGLNVGDPISANDGAHHFAMTLLDLGGPMSLRFELKYRLGSSDESFCTGLYGSFESGLNQYLERYIENEKEYVAAHLRNDDYPVFEKIGSDWVLDEGSAVRYVLKETGASVTAGFYYLLDPMQHHVFIFQKPASASPDYSRMRVIAQLDRNGNALTYTYPDGEEYRPQRISDGLGRRLDFTYSDYGNTTVADQAGRSLLIVQGVDEDAARHVVKSVRDAAGQITTFRYAVRDTNFAVIDKITRPLGNAPYTQTAATVALNNSAPTKRITSQTDAYGNTVTLAYAADANQVTETRPDDSAVTYQHYDNFGLPQNVTDPQDQSFSVTQTASQQVASVTDRMGDTSQFTYHPNTGMLASATNAFGQTLTCAYAAQDQTFTNPLNSETVTFTLYNMTRITSPDSSYEAFTYDAHGNLLTHTDQAGKVWNYTYNARGQVLTGTDPDGGVSTNTYNADGTLATSRDNDTADTTYGYDAYKRLTSIAYPGGSSVTIAYNLNDQITSLTDENGHVTQYAYDANGNLTVVTDAKDNTTQYAYDLMDRVTQITDRLGQSGTTAYDSRSRVASITDPTSLQTTYAYNGHGWQTGVTVAGQTWTTAYNAEGVVTSRATPLNRQTTYTSDKLGRTTGATDPLNRTSTLTYDARGRLASVADPLHRATAYAYDARGLLNKVTLPNGQFASYAYTNRGLLSSLTDLNNQTWQFGYTTAGRWNSTTDPLGNQTTQTSTTRGWPAVTTSPGGVTLTRTYDAAGNVTQNAYSTGLSLNYTYDELNRLTTADGVSLEYDAEGRLTASVQNTRRFTATYAAAGRLATVSYNNAALTVTYTYNARSLLAQVSDTLGNSVTFTYDDDHRLTGLTRSNGVAGVYDYDAAGQLTRLREGALADLQFTYNAAGEIASANLTVPLDPSAALTTGATTLTYDAAAQISSAGYAHDAQGRLTAQPGTAFTWDAASRLTGINGVTLAYNGVDDLTQRAEGSSVTQFLYHHALGLAPIAAELDGSGAAQRYYVWTPGGQLLWAVNAANGNAVSFYHFDQIGSALALTNGAGTVTDAYAYDPFGKLVAHTGDSPQPFTFVGQWGVRQETTTLYHARARYYDAATGRFVSREPLWPNLNDPAQNNPYQYARNNPVSLADYTGLEVLFVFKGGRIISQSKYEEEEKQRRTVHIINAQGNIVPYVQDQLSYERDSKQSHRRSIDARDKNTLFTINPLESLISVEGIELGVAAALDHKISSPSNLLFESKSSSNTNFVQEYFRRQFYELMQGNKEALRKIERQILPQRMAARQRKLDRIRAEYARLSRKADDPTLDDCQAINLEDELTQLRHEEAVNTLYLKAYQDQLWQLNNINAAFRMMEADPPSLLRQWWSLLW